MYPLIPRHIGSVVAVSISQLELNRVDLFFHLSEHMWGGSLAHSQVSFGGSVHGVTRARPHDEWRSCYRSDNVCTDLAALGAGGDLGYFEQLVQWVDHLVNIDSKGAQTGRCCFGSNLEGVEAGWQQIQ